MNDVLNAARRRDIAARAFIPTRVLSMLLICIAAASAALGFALSDSKKQRFHAGAILLLTLYAISFVLILDIDGSMKGAITVSQRPMRDLAAQLDANSP